jgi:hypothetical protein
VVVGLEDPTLAILPPDAIEHMIARGMDGTTDVLQDLDRATIRAALAKHGSRQRCATLEWKGEE